MKNSHFLVIGLFFLSLFTSANAQENTQDDILGNTEIKLNVGYTLLSFPEISFEQLLGEESALGVSLAFALEDDIEYKFIGIPYYRLYFGEKRAAGFFIEGNGAVFFEEADNARRSTEMGAGLGLAIGGKFITQKGWFAEIVAGGGRNFVNEDVISGGYPRLGISFGKRF